LVAVRCSGWPTLCGVAAWFVLGCNSIAGIGVPQDRSLAGDADLDVRSLDTAHASDDGPDPDAARGIEDAAPVDDARASDDVASRDATNATDGGGAEGGAGEGGPIVCPSRRGPAMVPIVVDGAKDFCIDATEVTNAQYFDFLYATDVGPQPPACSTNDSYVPGGDWPAPPNRADYPVTDVDWCDAWAYCNWAGKRLCGRLGGGALLPGQSSDPSASQWFFACSHGGTRSTPNGSMTMCNSHSANIGQLLPSGTTQGCEGGYAGIFDMVGNVAEWIDACVEGDGGRTCYLQGGSFADAVQSCSTLYSWNRTDSDFDYGIRCCSR
jgi:formylglycine-generating enzyme required for sulfatase activity